MDTVKRLVCISVLLSMLSACGGGGSSASSVTTSQITAISPSTVTAGGSSFILTVTGQHFSPQSSVQWNTDSLTTHYVSADELTAQVYYDRIVSPAVVKITVRTLPDDTSSNAVNLTVANPTPTLDSVWPNSIGVGGTSFTLNVYGSGFTPATVVEWNGAARTTTFVTSTDVTAEISPADIASMQTAVVTVTNSGPGAGTSAPLYVPVYLALNQTVSDIAWDSKNQVLYASVPSSASTHANTVLTLDPNTGTVLASVAAGSDPHVLALADDDSYLYVGEDGTSTVQRFTLPGVKPDIAWSLPSSTYGPNIARAIEVAPGAPHTTAVSVGEPGITSYQQGVVIYDDATTRTNVAPGTSPTSAHYYDSLQWGADDTVLYGAEAENGSDFYVMSVDTNGVTLSQDIPSTTFGDIHYDAGTGELFVDTGRILATTGAVIGQLPTTELADDTMIPDDAGNRAFLVTEPAPGNAGIDIHSYDMTTLEPLTTLHFYGINGTAADKIIRWGPDGLALVINDGFDAPGTLLLLKGTFVH
jgi:trimeric autotransporter adhesin